MIYWCQSATSKRFKNSGEDLKDLFSWIKHFAGRKTKLPVVDTRGNYDRWLYLCTWSNCECTVVDGFICVYHMFVWWECGMWCTSGAVRSDGGRKHYPAKETWKVMGDVSVWHFNLCFDFVLFHFVLFFVVVVLCYGHWQRYLLEMQLLPVKPEVPICLSVCAPVCVCVCEIRFSIPANIDVCVRIKEAEISYLLCYTFLLQSQTSVLLPDKCVPAQYTFSLHFILLIFQGFSVLSLLVCSVPSCFSVHVISCYRTRRLQRPQVKTVWQAFQKTASSWGLVNAAPWIPSH